MPDPEPSDFDVAVLGGGSAAEALVAALGHRELRIVVFEAHRVGGECPFVACMPSKAMLHDAAAHTGWRDAIERRSGVIDHLDDSRHAEQLAAHGALLVRAAATITAPGRIEAAGSEYTAEHIVLATGSELLMPPIEGIEELGDRCWTSEQALLTEDRPTRLAIIGGGAIGCELATIFARFGSEVHLLDVAPQAFPDLPPAIGERVDDALRAAGVRVCRGIEIEQVACRGGGVRTTLANGAGLDTDRIIVAAGRRPLTQGLGLEQIGVADPARLAVDDTGRVTADGSVWAIGDVAGRGQYTHVANHHANVVANALCGDGTRRFDDVVTPACVFTDPPLMTIGPRPAELSDDDVVWVSANLSETPRWTTDALADGVLTIAVDRRSRTVVAAHGVGASFDVLAAALVTAIDGRIPVDQLTRSMWPFPSIGEILGVVYSRAVESLGDA
ncbi:MAG TPA: NAD(P)/FAD-dependent oxidoreductase [Ilumatobacteraceae bacterium]|nr:NAD(P)/FAD-dependent oxidoreductase [Ilumatobacteraceae bacterium]